MTFAPALQQFRDRPGWALSLVLHLGMSLLALWYLAARPLLAPPSRTFPVDLVTLSPAPGASGALPAPRPGAPKPRPAAAPHPEGVRPEAVQQPLDELSAKLRALAQLSAPETSLAAGGGNGDAGVGSGNGGYALRDFIRAQILRRWLPALSDATSRATMVRLRLNVSNGGIISDVVIADGPRFRTDAIFHGMALSARNAALLASPIQMPPGNWPKVIPLEIDLDPKAALQ
ncbi:MAG: hypothetical protein JO256_04140 [Alphaproteobacteria bacterium]|nr:hypothetical protein [Alphaproteobacteria bacterium]